MSITDAGLAPDATASLPPDPEPIMRAATGFMAAKHLFVASELGLFEALADGPADAFELADRAGLPADTTRISADAMVALGLLELEDGRYRNGAEAGFFLAGRTPTDLRPFLRFWNQLATRAWGGLEQALRGSAPAHHLTAEEVEVFSLGVESITGGTAHALSLQPEIGDARRALDIGGGTGSFLRAALHSNPELSGTVVELPSVAAIAERRLADEPRIDVIAADVLRDPLPGDHDLIIVANLVHLFDEQGNRTLMRRLREAASQGATLMAVDFWTDPTRTDPPAAALMAGEFLLWSEGAGRSYAEEEARDWLAEAGWTVVERRALAGPQSVIVARAG